MPKHKEKPGENFFKVDAHAQPVNFNYDGGHEKFKTRVGSVLTMLEIATLLWFATSKLTLMASKESTSISSNTEFPEAGHAYGGAENFTFAFGISSWNGIGNFDYADYVTIHAAYNNWNDIGNLTTTPLQTIPCTASDFGVNGIAKSDNSKFFNAAPNMASIFTEKINVLECLDQDVELIGNLNSATAQTINLMVLACDINVNPNCKSQSEIKEFLKTQYMYLVYNVQLFNPTGFDADTFTKVSIIQKIPININDSTMTSFDFVPTTLNATDSVWGGSENYEFYNLVQTQSFSFYQIPNLLTGISFQVSQTGSSTSRIVLSFFSVAAQVGGFSRLAKLIFLLLLFFTRTWGGDKFLVANMYKLMLNEEEVRERRETIMRESMAKRFQASINEQLTEPMQPRPTQIKKEQDELIVKARESYEARDRVKVKRSDRFKKLFRGVFFCCGKYKDTERDYAFKKGQEKLAAEMDIKRILNTLRLFRVSLKFLTTPTQRKLMRMQAESSVIELKPSEYDNLKVPLGKKRLHDLTREQELSSAFSSEEAMEFIENLDYAKGSPPTEKEMQLIMGIMTKNEREKQGDSARDQKLFDA